MTPKQAHTRRLKGIAYGLATAHIQRAIDSTDWSENNEGVSEADARRVNQYLERIAQDLRNKAHDYENSGIGEDVQP